MIGYLPNVCQTLNKIHITNKKNHQNVRFLSNTGPDPIKIKKTTTNSVFNVGPSLARQ